MTDPARSTICSPFGLALRWVALPAVGCRCAQRARAKARARAPAGARARARARVNPHPLLSSFCHSDAPTAIGAVQRARRACDAHRIVQTRHTSVLPALTWPFTSPPCGFCVSDSFVLASEASVEHCGLATSETASEGGRHRPALSPARPHWHGDGHCGVSTTSSARCSCRMPFCVKLVSRRCRLLRQWWQCCVCRAFILPFARISISTRCHHEGRLDQ